MPLPRNNNTKLHGKAKSGPQSAHEYSWVAGVWLLCIVVAAAFVFGVLLGSGMYSLAPLARWQW